MAPSRFMLLLILLIAGGCARVATEEEKQVSFQPFAQRRLGSENLRDFIEDRSAVLVAGARPLEVQVHQDQVGVTLKPMNADNKVDEGSAAAVTRDGYFLTAAHCVRRKPVFLLIYTPAGPLACDARVVWQPPPDEDDCDVAVLKTSAALPAAFSPAPDSDITVGAPVVTTGANGEAGGKLLEVDSVDADPDDGIPQILTLVHDAPLAEGDSGGPLTTLDGKLMGIEVLVRGGFVRPREGIALRPDPAWLMAIIQQDRRRGR